jgi:predicted HicB family RNase H-like nuclease
VTQQNESGKQPIKRINLAMPMHLYKRAVAIAEYRGCSINALIRELLWEWVEAQERKAPAESKMNDKETVRGIE